MNKGCWLWVIPLSSEYTSIGVVIDDQYHDFSHIKNYDALCRWINDVFSPCRSLLADISHSVTDFKFIRNYAHGCKQVYSSNRWAIIGVAGVFPDPFYSPGTDIIAMSNDFITELVDASIRGVNIDSLATTYNRLYLQFFDIILGLYEGAYKQFGNPIVMKKKILWDSVIYLSVTCLLYFNKKLIDTDFMQMISPSMAVYNRLNYRVQSYLYRTLDDDADKPHDGFTDLSEVRLFGTDINKALRKSFACDEDLAKLIQVNITHLEKIAARILTGGDILGDDCIYTPRVSSCDIGHTSA